MGVHPAIAQKEDIRAHYLMFDLGLTLSIQNYFFFKVIGRYYGVIFTLILPCNIDADGWKCTKSKILEYRVCTQWYLPSCKLFELLARKC